MGRSRKIAEKVSEKSANSPDLDENPTIQTDHETKKGRAKKLKPVEISGEKENKAKPLDSEVSVAKKRGRPSKAAETPAKKFKLDFRHKRGFGHVLTLGQGDTGQLGLGEDIMERSRPKVVVEIPEAVDIVAAGMHTICLNKDGEVFTFGCNDEGALGRTVEEEEEAFLPGKVDICGRVVQISGGDSHSAALTEDGVVFAWGTFRDSSGPIGLTKAGIQQTPIRILPDIAIKKIGSGADHIAMLSIDGNIYSVGNGEQGQLGRVNEKFSQRGGRRGLDMLLKPEKLHLKKKFSDVWAGSYNTLALASTGEMLVMGLNNYNQLGIDHGLTFFMPTVSPSFTAKKWQQISLGQHHALALDDQGKVYAIGRSEYGRLGLEEGRKDDATVPTLVPSLSDLNCVEVACGSAVSFAVSDSGECFSWGMGTNGQLGTGEDEDVELPHKMKSKELETRGVIGASSGGQHTVLIAKEK